LPIILVSILIVTLFLIHGFLGEPMSNSETREVLVGIDIAHDNVAHIKMIGDEISSYMTLIVIGITGITYNNEKLDKVATTLSIKDYPS
jgi:hypothetical protein